MSTHFSGLGLIWYLLLHSYSVSLNLTPGGSGVLADLARIVADVC